MAKAIRYARTGGPEVLEVVDVDVEASSCLLHADRDRAAIRARAAHCAIGDLIIRNS